MHGVTVRLHVMVTMRVMAVPYPGELNDATGKKHSPRKHIVRVLPDTKMTWPDVRSISVTDSITLLPFFNSSR